MVEPTERNHLPTLTGLRALGAALVFGRHLAELLDQAGAGPYVQRLLLPGASGVSLFFVLSGFVLTWSLPGQLRPGPYLRRRIARLYPLHLVTALVALALASAVGAGTIAANLLLVQAWSRDPSVYYSLNTPSWSLSCELAFSVALAVTARHVGRLGGRAGVALLIAALAAVLALDTAVALVGPRSAAWIAYINPVARGAEFVAGVGLARAVVAGRWPRVSLRAALALAAAAYLAAGWTPFPFDAVGTTVVPYVVLIGAAAMHDRAGQTSWWSSSMAVRLGRWSFAFYLVQRLILDQVVEAWPGLGDNLASAAGTAVAVLAASIAAAALLHRVVEQPARRALRGAAVVSP